MADTFTDISTQIWDMKYRYKTAGEAVDHTVEDSWRRCATAVASVEKDAATWEANFMELLSDYKFLPGGRILANAGTLRDSTTMFNCYVMNTIPDSMDGIFDVIKEAALTQKQGGGVGFDFSTIRPSGDHINGVDSQASGPISFMHVLDATCRTIMSAGQRRGAQMAMLRCDHPDIEAFIAAKRENAALRMFNLSVAATDPFIEAVRQDKDWDLVFGGHVYKTIKARELWDKIMDSTYNWAEPGVIFIDRINKMNNLYYCEKICATNPCGEQPLPPSGACLLGSINLTRFVANPFEADCRVDFEGIKRTTALAVRFLDNVIDISNYPLKAQDEEAHNKRRMGIGITGLANLFLFMRLRYGSRKSVELGEKIMKTICQTAYETSAEIAAEKGSFPMLDKAKYLKGKFIKNLPEETQAKIEKHGIRNSHLISIAPTGTISLFAGNASSGLEPVFAYYYTRRIRQSSEDDVMETEVMDYGYRKYIEKFGRPENDAELPEYFVSSDAVHPREHVEIQAGLQKYVDSSISKTINVPEDYDFEDFKDIYMYAYENNLKGCTTFRPNASFSGVLVKNDDKAKEEEAEAARKAKAALDVIEVRPYVLQGTTYKIKTPLASEAIYVTINDVVEDGQRRPYELFINTKNLQHFSWIVAMTRLISAVFRRERDPSFLVDELKSIYDPNGGYFSGGSYIPSLAADIGRIVEEHLINIGLIKRKDVEGKNEKSAPRTADTSKFSICPNCNQKSLMFEENCMKCTSCLYSKCG